MLYSTIVVILCLIVIAWLSYQYYKHSISRASYILWLILWLAIMLFAIFPQVSTILADIFGIGRGLDALYIMGFIVLLYISFRLYNKVEEQTKRINDLVTQLAINEEDEKDD